MNFATDSTASWNEIVDAATMWFGPARNIYDKPALLLKDDHIRTAQGRGVRLQRFVGGVGAILIQYLELADRHFVVGCG
jgi:hypothetical protein